MANGCRAIALTSLSLVLLTGCGSRAPARPTGSIAPSDQTVVAEVDPGISGQAIYVTNNSSFPIRVTGLRLFDCRNVQAACTMLALSVDIDPGQRRRIALIRPQDTEQAYSYRYSFSWITLGSSASPPP